jgi:Uma2 family endonuclease
MAASTAIKQDVRDLIVLPDYDYTDYEKWEGRWELIEGLPFAMSPSPVRRHQIISLNIAIELAEKLENCQKCRSYFNLDWIISDKTVVCPDNMVVCDDDMQENFIRTTPAIIFEILSPKTIDKDRVNKFRIYEKQGVKYYVIIDPSQLIADVYCLKYNKFLVSGQFATEIFSFDIDYCCFDFNFGNMFKELR